MSFTPSSLCVSSSSLPWEGLVVFSLLSPVVIPFNLPVSTTTYRLVCFLFNRRTLRVNSPCVDAKARFRTEEGSPVTSADSSCWGSTRVSWREKPCTRGNNSLCNTAHNHENLVFVSAALWSSWCLAEVRGDQLDVVDCLPARLGSRCGVVAPREHSCRAGPREHAFITQATERGSSSPTARLSLCEDWGGGPWAHSGDRPQGNQHWRASSLFSSVWFFYSIAAISVSLRRSHGVKSNLGISLTHKTVCLFLTLMSKGLHCSSDGKQSACNTEDPGSIPGLGRSSGEGNGNPLQYSCLEIPGTEEPGGLQFMGSQRVGRDWATNTTLMSRRHRCESAHNSLTVLMLSEGQFPSEALPALWQREKRDMVRPKLTWKVFLQITYLISINIASLKAWVWPFMNSDTQGYIFPSHKKINNCEQRNLPLNSGMDHTCKCYQSLWLWHHWNVLNINPEFKKVKKYRIIYWSVEVNFQKRQTTWFRPITYKV